MRKPTYKQARIAILDLLRSSPEWTVSGPLKVPHATHTGGLRLWFAPQSVHYEAPCCDACRCNGLCRCAHPYRYPYHYRRSNAHSLWVDIRTIPAAQFVAWIYQQVIRGELK